MVAKNASHCYVIRTLPVLCPVYLHAVYTRKAEYRVHKICFVAS